MSKLHSSNYFKDTRRFLRQHQTISESLLWQEIRNYKIGLKFRRQHSIGQFVVDFYCPERRLIIEIDGLSHKNKSEKDSDRDQYLKQLNYTVLRFSSTEIEQNIKTVVNTLQTTNI